MEGAGGEDSLAHTRAHVLRERRGAGHMLTSGARRDRLLRGPSRDASRTHGHTGATRVVVQEGDES